MDLTVYYFVQVWGYQHKLGCILLCIILGLSTQTWLHTIVYHFGAINTNLAAYFCVSF